MLCLLKGKAHFGQQFVFEDVAETSVFLDELIENKGELPRMILQSLTRQKPKMPTR
jgi:hypothetical protein